MVKFKVLLFLMEINIKIIDILKPSIANNLVKIKTIIFSISIFLLLKIMDTSEERHTKQIEREIIILLIMIICH